MLCMYICNMYVLTSANISMRIQATGLSFPRLEELAQSSPYTAKIAEEFAPLVE